MELKYYIKMPQLRPYKWMQLLCTLCLVLIISLYFFHQVYLPRVLALTRIRTYFRDLKVVSLDILNKMLLIIGGILVALIVISLLLSTNSRDTSKLSGYECGLEPMGDAKAKLKIVYYIIGVLYLLFDLEIVFLYPLAASLWLINNYIALGAIIIFIILLTLTFIYEWFKGALELS